MNYKFQTFLLIIACWATQTTFAQYHIRQPDAIPLHGEWLFALDPAETGVTNKWYTNKTAESGRMDKVVVPHCFSSDPRYAGIPAQSGI
jgi:beta-glucuronidase